MKNIYIMGHKHLDTDPICRCIDYAAFQNINGNKSYIATRCGKLKAETKYALSKFGIESPVLILDLEPSVPDLPSLYTESATAKTPTYDVIEQMDKNNLRNLPITDENRKPVGLVREHGLARAYMSNRKMEKLTISPVSIDTLSHILGGKIFVRSQEILEGSVYISIDALHVILSRITSKDIAIVGDDGQTQLALLSAGIVALILAKEKGVSIIGTYVGFWCCKYDSSDNACLMTTDMETVRNSDNLEAIKQIVTHSKYRVACVC